MWILPAESHLGALMWQRHRDHRRVSLGLQGLFSSLLCHQKRMALWGGCLDCCLLLRHTLLKVLNLWEGLPLEKYRVFTSLQCSSSLDNLPIDCLYAATWIPPLIALWDRMWQGQRKRWCCQWIPGVSASTWLLIKKLVRQVYQQVMLWY